MNELGITLLWLALQTTVLCTFAAIVYLIARRGCPAVGASAALSGLVLAAVLSVLVISPWPQWQTDVDGDSNETVGTSVTDADAETQPRAEVEFATNDGLEAWGLAGLDMESISRTWREWESSRSQSVATEEQSASTIRWEGWAAGIFVVGVLAAMIRLVAGLIAVMRMRISGKSITDDDLQAMLEGISEQLDVTRRIELFEYKQLTSAATIGWLRPVILLPADWPTWTDAERRAVLAHEVAHIAHNDFSRWVCAQLGVLLHFYHPLVHWLASRLRLEQELAADATAAKVVGDARGYLRSLAELAMRQSSPKVAWPARTFLPSMGTMARRIEMLREAKARFAERPIVRRLLVMITIVAAGLLVSGFRQPEADQLQAQDAAKKGQRVTLRQAKAKQAGKKQGGSKQAVPAAKFDLSLVPDSTKMLIALRPAAVAGQQLLGPITPFIDETVLKKAKTGLSVANLEQVLVVGFSTVDSGAMDGSPTIFIKTVEPVDFQKFINVDGGKITETKHGDHVLYRQDKIGSQAYVVLDEKTLLLGNESRVKAVLAQGKPNNSLLWRKRVASVGDSHFCYLADMNTFRPDIERGLQGPANPIANAFSPLWKDTQQVIGSARLARTTSFKLSAWCADEDGAVRVQNTAKAVIPLLKNMLIGAKNQQEKMPPAARAGIAAMIAFTDALLDQIKITQNGTQVVASAETDMGSVPLMVGLLLPAVQSARDAARRTQSMNNMKQIGLALHNYHSVHKRFPAAVMTGPDGKTKHSWRVAILPYLEQKALHDQYKFDEPWDSEANRKVLEAMPNVFRSPYQAANHFNSTYFALTGGGAAFNESGDGARIRDFVDGTSNTILAVEAERTIPWTKPEDIKYDPEKPLPKFGGFHRNNYNVLLADGSVHALSNTMAEKILRIIITRGGREIVPAGTLH